MKGIIIIIKRGFLHRKFYRLGKTPEHSNKTRGILWALPPPPQPSQPMHLSSISSLLGFHNIAFFPHGFCDMLGLG